MDLIIEQIVQNLSPAEIEKVQAQFQVVIAQPGNEAHFVMMAIDEMNSSKKPLN